MIPSAGAGDASEPDTPKPTDVTDVPNGDVNPVRVARRKAVDDYIAEVLSLKHTRITRTDIWKAAGYKTRTQFERWERCAPNATEAADQNFTRILKEKPHSK